MSDKVENLIAAAISQKFADLIMSDENFWPMVDQAIAAHILETEQEEAQIWLSNDGGDRVCVTIFGADEPLLMPFFIPEVDLPVRPDATAQIQAANEQIANLRRFATKLIEQADEGQKALDAILGVTPSAPWPSAPTKGP